MTKDKQFNVNTSAVNVKHNQDSFFSEFFESEILLIVLWVTVCLKITM